MVIKGLTDHYFNWEYEYGFGGIVEFFAGTVEFSSHHSYPGMPNSDVELPNHFKDTVSL